MFRDNQVAQYEREMAEMRARLDAEKVRADQLKMEADKMREKAEALDMERSLQPGPFKRFLNRMATPRRRQYGLAHRPSLHTWLFGIGIVLIVVALGFSFYHYCTDIQEGVVTGRTYHPPSTSCTTDSQGHTSCTTIPEHWTVDIAFEGQTATWSVSHSEWERIRYGDWFCYTDMFHSQDNCRGRP